MGKVSFQKLMVYNGKLLCQFKGLRVICLFEIRGELLIKTGEVEIDFLMNRIDLHSGKISKSLDIHVLKVIDLRELGPEWNIQSQGYFQSSFNICMGHNAHGCGEAIG
jgi:hypothetical protein